MTTAGSETILYSFKGGSDGATPGGGEAGATGYGTVFSIRP
jgi:hypothetical protein